MKLIIVLAALVAVAVGAPQKDVGVVRYDNDNIGVGGYNFAVELTDGSSHQETAELHNAGSENEAIAVRGTFSFVAPDGVQYTVNYIADENGFQPQGAHLPQKP